MKRTTLDGRVYHDDGWKEPHDRSGFGSVAFVELSPDTEPAVIAARHREEVSDAYHIRGLETPEEIGEAIVLPASLVRRHLEALGLLEPTPHVAPGERVPRGEMPELVRKLLARSKTPLLCKEIAAKLNVIYQSVYYALKIRPDLFVGVPAGTFRGSTIYAWKLRQQGGSRVIAEPTAAALLCPGCKREFRVAHNIIRAAIESDRTLKCQHCTTPRITAADVIVQSVARLLSRREDADCDLSSIVIEAWSQGQQTFGLKGHESRYPNSKRVECELVKLTRTCGRRKPWLVRTRPLHYQLTKSGRERVQALKGEA